VPDDTTLDPDSLRARATGRPATRPALVIIHSREEPHRVGEVLLAPHASKAEPRIIGRGAARDDDPHPRGGWLRQRPGDNRPTPPLAASAISRVQLVVEPHPEGLRLRNLGRRELRIDGAPTDDGVAREGSVIGLEDELGLLLGSRPVALPTPRAWPAEQTFDFGAADPFGIVGESPAAWALRDELAFAAARPLHVLLHGPTGTGKELAARAIHALAATDGPLVARNAATIPESLVDAELFGNLRDYPNPGMPAREGLVGAADGSTLFLDEIGELPDALQAHLLRVLDRGEYQRLGEDTTRTSRFRLLGATNRPLERIKHDLLARLTLRVQLPALHERPEDIPLLADHLVREAAHDDEALGAQLVDPALGRARIAPTLIEALVRHRYSHGVRELVSILWRCIAKSPGEWITPPADVLAELAREAPAAVEPDALSPDEVRAALEEHDWVVSRAWRGLGLKSRHVLNRLIKKHGIERPA